MEKVEGKREKKKKIDQSKKEVAWLLVCDCDRAVPVQFMSHFILAKNHFWSLNFESLDTLITQVSKMSLWSFKFDIIDHFGHFC